MAKCTQSVVLDVDVSGWTVIPAFDAQLGTVAIRYVEKMPRSTVVVGLAVKAQAAAPVAPDIVGYNTFVACG